MKLTALAALPLSLLFACSSAGNGTSSATSSTSPTSDADGGTTDDGGATATDDAGPADMCAPAPKKSGCSNESSWVRGTAHWDPSHFKAGAPAPVMRVSLRHGFSLVAGEEKIGGRLHAYSTFKIDPKTGEAPFSVDMCDFGTAMWSEENGTFHLVLMIDENGNNNLDNATSNEDAIALATPDPTELQAMVDVDVSCHAPSQCMDVKLDCTGTTCLTITPIKSCKKKTPSCKSDDAFCT
jgi:hypothetical protein